MRSLYGWWLRNTPIKTIAHPTVAGKADAKIQTILSNTRIPRTLRNRINETVLQKQQASNKRMGPIAVMLLNLSLEKPPAKRSQIVTIQAGNAKQTARCCKPFALTGGTEISRLFMLPNVQAQAQPGKRRTA